MEGRENWRIERKGENESEWMKTGLESRKGKEGEGIR